MDNKDARIYIGSMYEDKHDEYIDTKDPEVKQDSDALYLAYESLDKAIPKKPVMIDDYLGYGDRVLSCPNCKEHIVNVWNRAKYEPKFCHYCGQRLEWD